MRLESQVQVRNQVLVELHVQEKEITPTSKVQEHKST